MATPVKPSAGSVYGYGRTAQYSETRTPVNPFGSSYEVDDAGAFDNPFEQTPTKQPLRRYAQVKQCAGYVRREWTLT